MFVLKVLKALSIYNKYFLLKIRKGIAIKNKLIYNTSGEGD